MEHWLTVGGPGRNGPLKHQTCSSSRCARSSPAALAQALPGAKVRLPDAAHAALAGSSCFFFHSVSIAESARPCAAQRHAVSTGPLAARQSHQSRSGAPGSLPGTTAASSAFANTLNKLLYAHCRPGQGPTSRTAALAGASQAHHSAHAASQRKGAKAVGVDAVGVQVAHVDLYARMVLGCDQLICPRAVRSIPSFVSAQRVCVDSEVLARCPARPRFEGDTLLRTVKAPSPVQLKPETAKEQRQPSCGARSHAQRHLRPPGNPCCAPTSTWLWSQVHAQARASWARSLAARTTCAGCTGPPSHSHR